MDLLLWIVSVGLLALGVLCIVGNLAIPFCYYILKSKKTGTWIPMVGGLCAFAGILLLPVAMDFPLRLAIATGLALLDISISIGFGWLVIAFFRGDLRRPVESED